MEEKGDFLTSPDQGAHSLGRRPVHQSTLVEDPKIGYELFPSDFVQVRHMASWVALRMYIGCYRRGNVHLVQLEEDLIVWHEEIVNSGCREDLEVSTVLQGAREVFTGISVLSLFRSVHPITSYIKGKCVVIAVSLVPQILSEMSVKSHG
jgi:hypothetical protein